MAVESIVTPFFRLSFPTVFKPKAVKGATKETFSIQMIFIDQAIAYKGPYRDLIIAPAGTAPEALTDLQKDYAKDPTLCIQMRRLLVAAMKDGWGDDKTKWPAPFNMVEVATYLSEDGKRFPIRDGNFVAWDGFKGQIFAKAGANADRQPGIARRDPKDNRPVLPSEVYGGLICRANVNAFTWANDAGGKGVSFGLNHLQLIMDDGTRFGSSAGPVEEAFGAWDGDGSMDPANYPGEAATGVVAGDEF